MVLLTRRQAALFDHIYLAQQLDDFSLITAQKEP